MNKNLLLSLGRVEHLTSALIETILALYLSKFTGLSLISKLKRCLRLMTDISSHNAHAIKYKGNDG